MTAVDNHDLPRAFPWFAGASLLLLLVLLAAIVWFNHMTVRGHLVDMVEARHLELLGAQRISADANAAAVAPRAGVGLASDTRAAIHRETVWQTAAVPPQHFADYSAEALARAQAGETVSLLGTGADTVVVSFVRLPVAADGAPVVAALWTDVSLYLDRLHRKERDALRALVAGFALIYLSLLVVARRLHGVLMRLQRNLRCGEKTLQHKTRQLEQALAERRRAEQALQAVGHKPVQGVRVTGELPG